MATGNITIAKGSYSVTIQTVEVDDNYSNNVINKIPTTTAPQNQSDGPSDRKIIDLLDITHELLVRGQITATSTKTAEDVRDDLISILKGAGVSAGSGNLYCTVTYGTHTYNMFIEKLAIKEVSSDYDPSSSTDEKANYTEVSKYDVQVTLIEGVSAFS